MQVPTSAIAWAKPGSFISMGLKRSASRNHLFEAGLLFCNTSTAGSPLSANSTARAGDDGQLCAAGVVTGGKGVHLGFGLDHPKLRINRFTTSAALPSLPPLCRQIARLTAARSASFHSAAGKLHDCGGAQFGAVACAGP